MGFPIHTQRRLSFRSNSVPSLLFEFVCPCVFEFVHVITYAPIVSVCVRALSSSNLIFLSYFVLFFFSV